MQFCHLKWSTFNHNSTYKIQVYKFIKYDKKAMSTVMEVQKNKNVLFTSSRKSTQNGNK